MRCASHPRSHARGGATPASGASRGWLRLWLGEQVGVQVRLLRLACAHVGHSQRATGRGFCHEEAAERAEHAGDDGVLQSAQTKFALTAAMTVFLFDCGGAEVGVAETAVMSVTEAGARLTAL